MSNIELQKDEEFVLKLVNITFPKIPNLMSNGCHNASMIILNDIKNRLEDIISRVNAE